MMIYNFEYINFHWGTLPGNFCWVKGLKKNVALFMPQVSGSRCVPERSARLQSCNRRMAVMYGRSASEANKSTTGTLP